MGFIKYQHVERFGTDEVAGIECGVCHVFPKIDGTNGSVWLEAGQVRTGSRNRALGEDGENQGFRAAIEVDSRILAYLTEHPEHRLYGEWLVPHSLKSYRDDAWRRFYVFDVCMETDEGEMVYLPYLIYQPMLETHGLDYIPLQAEIRNGTYEQLVKMLDSNTFLMKDGHGAGEGVVVKNYGYKNKYGRTTWAKFVRAEFKEIHIKTMGAPIINGGRMVEQDIAEKYCTDALIEKEYSKIVAEAGGWRSQYIPRLLSSILHAVVTENTWDVVKTFKMPTINFKTLNYMVIERIKTAKSELFA